MDTRRLAASPPDPKPPNPRAYGRNAPAQPRSFWVRAPLWTTIPSTQADELQRARYGRGLLCGKSMVRLLWGGPEDQGISESAKDNRHGMISTVTTVTHYVTVITVS